MIQSLVQGIGLGLLLSIAVGPVLFSTIKQSLNNGMKGGMAFVAGVSASDITLVLISNVFTQLFAELKEYSSQIGIAGCAFLVSMGVYFLFFKKIKVNEEGRQVLLSFGASHYVKIFASGYIMNVLNPGCILFWITWSTAFIAHSINARIVIFTTCLIVVLGLDVAKVLLAGKIRNRLTPHNIHLINRLNGIILIVFGIALIWGLLVMNR
ncbi:MAG: lysine transporter LysE [Chitinophagaceae bacterium]|nr:MAG: lysine transporter LysE [Chitinophagaceae bacterium]